MGAPTHRRSRGRPLSLKEHREFQRLTRTLSTDNLRLVGHLMQSLEDAENRPGYAPHEPKERLVPAAERKGGA
jgi:hypothetical protein